MSLTNLHASLFACNNNPAGFDMHVCPWPFTFERNLSSCSVCTDRLSPTLQGRRALDFVLKNQGLIDKTLLFDIELMRIN